MSLQNEMLSPADVSLTENGEQPPHFIVRDEVFPLKPYLLRQYSKSNVIGNGKVKCLIS
jgi:hypothetical protein